MARAADALRPVAHARDVPLVVADHFRLAGRLGLDGVHLADGARQVREARKALGADAIVGAFARASRHDGLTAAEIGADYVAFGPVGADRPRRRRDRAARPLRVVVGDDRGPGRRRRRPDPALAAASPRTPTSSPSAKSSGPTTPRGLAAFAAAPALNSGDPA